MSFPTNPAANEIYKNYIFTNDRWVTLNNSNKPAFLAYGLGTSNAYPSESKCLFKHTYVNVNNCYDIASGDFVAPCEGDYFFSWSQIGNTISDVYRYFILKNDVKIDDYHLRISNFPSKAEYNGGADRCITLHLLKNNRISIYFVSDGGNPCYSDGQYATFSGHLI